MAENNKHKKYHLFEQEQTTLVLFLASVAFVLLIWLSEIMINDLPFGFTALKRIHLSSSLWLVDLLPVFVVLAHYYYVRETQRIKDKLSTEIHERERRIEKYADHAKRLGQGDYFTPLQLHEQNDNLGTALQYLQGYLRATYRKESYEDWISQGKDQVSRLLRLQNNLDDLAFNTIKTLTDYIKVEQGALYIYDEDSGLLTCKSTYAYNRKKFVNQQFSIGEGLVGQCAFEMDFVHRIEIPEDYTTISSGILGEQKPRSILLIPLIIEEKLQGVVEFASIKRKFQKVSIQFMLEIGEIIARTIYNLKINEQTRILLEESRKMTEELRENEKTLQENAELMKKTQRELQESNIQLEAKIIEVENAQSKLHWLLENASEIISIYDENLNMTYVSPSVKKILGYTPGEMMKGKDFERLTHEGAQSLKRLISDTAADPFITRTIQYSYITKEGKRIYVESTSKNLLDDPAIEGIIVNTREITERMRAEREERLKSRMQSLSENSHDLIMRISTSGQIYYTNPVVEEYLGIETDSLNGKNLSEVEFTSDFYDYIEQSLTQLKSNPQKTNKELMIPFRFNEVIKERILSVDAIPEYNSNELETILFVGHDITENKRIEKELQLKNQKIQDSINYAERIQSSLLPDFNLIRAHFPKSFILYKPRDVISGDFPWFYLKDNDIYIAAVDCTGHGVPGALLSFIAFFLLNDVVKNSNGQNAGEICDILHDRFRETLKQNTARADARDGMDIALCKINLDKSLIEYAGAHRHLYQLSHGELIEHKGNRKAIGGIPLLKKTEENFTNHMVQINKGDKIFFFSDGLTDQLGGPYGRKFSPKRVRNNILDNPGHTMPQYRELFENDFAEWQKGFKQLDDVLMIGIEF